MIGSCLGILTHQFFFDKVPGKGLSFLYVVISQEDSSFDPLLSIACRYFADWICFGMVLRDQHYHAGPSDFHKPVDQKSNCQSIASVFTEGSQSDLPNSGHFALFWHQRVYA